MSKIPPSYNESISEMLVPPKYEEPKSQVVRTLTAKQTKQELKEFKKNRILKEKEDKRKAFEELNRQRQIIEQALMKAITDNLPSVADIKDFIDENPHATSFTIIKLNNLYNYSQIEVISDGSYLELFDTCPEGWTIIKINGTNFKVVKNMRKFADSDKNKYIAIKDKAISYRLILSCFKKLESNELGKLICCVDTVYYKL